MPIVLLALLYAAVVVAVARWRGLRALIGLVGAYFVLASFMLPGLVEGKAAAAAGPGGIHGDHDRGPVLRPRLLGEDLHGPPGHHLRAGITALLAAWATDAANLAGVGNHEAATLMNTSANISISGMILCGLIISGLGCPQRRDHHTVLRGVGTV
jgi:hypothetical protein